MVERSRSESEMRDLQEKRYAQLECSLTLRITSTMEALFFNVCVYDAVDYLHVPRANLSDASPGVVVGQYRVS